MDNMDMIAMTLLHLVDSCGISELSCVSAPETRLLLCLIRYLGGLLRWLEAFEEFHKARDSTRSERCPSTMLRQLRL